MSELALGWATFNGDHMSMYAVNAGVPKTLVQYLVRVFGEMHPELEEVLAGVLATEISPELLPPDAAGRIQSTEAALGPYALHDFFLYHVMKSGFARAKIETLAAIAFPEIDKALLSKTAGPLNPEAAPDRLRALSVQRSHWKRARRFRLPEVPSW